MVTKSWMYDAIIYIYALSLLFYFSDFASKNQKAKRMGSGLLAFVWVLQTLFFILRMLEHEVGAMYSMFGTLFFLSWLMVTLSLLLNVLLRIDFLVFFVNIAGFAILALNFFSDASISPILDHWDIADELLFIHISLAICSYAAFLISAIFSGMYLFLHKQLKEKQWSEAMRRIPSLEKIERYMYRTVMMGTPLFIMSLTLGMVWISLKDNLQLLFDPKVINSLIIIGGYAFYLIQRHSFKVAGHKLALWNLAVFAFVILNYVLSNFLSKFHQWIWM